jgi:hypothetical protein
MPCLLKGSRWDSGWQAQRDFSAASLQRRYRLINPAGTSGAVDWGCRSADSGSVDLSRPNDALAPTRQQHSALLGVLVEYTRDPNATQEWGDVLTDTTVTLSDLLTLVATAEQE